MRTELEIIDVNNGGYRNIPNRNHLMRSAGRQTRKRKRRMQRLYWTVACLLCVAIILSALVVIKQFRAGTGENLGAYQEITAHYRPNRPREIEQSEAVNELTALLAEYPEFSNICENAERYPEKLLAALCNNPEMYEFVRDYPESDGSVTEGLRDAELEEEYPLFLQWDKRWGYASYGDSMIGLAGCGPTCLSMVITALKKDGSVTPDQVAAYSMDNGYYVEGTGTAWSLMTDGISHYGITANEISLDENVMKKYLDNGCPIICSMRAGDFTAAGHFIVICGYDKDGFKVNDPNCIARSEKRWSFDELYAQIRILWAYTV